LVRRGIRRRVGLVRRRRVDVVVSPDIAAGLRAEVVELHEARATYEAARITLSRAYQAAEQRHMTRIADLSERLGVAARDIERLAAANNALRAENRRLTTARGLPPVGNITA
jgi:hypothetical protein